MAKTLFWITFIAVLLMPQPTLNTLVTTSSGPIRGNIVTFNGSQIRTFLGIPYAKPPVGKLRFMKPVPVERWDTVLEAVTLPPGCNQYSSNPFPWLDDLPGLSEDCLYLNIWAPVQTRGSEKKAVMFWIHGGGFRISSSRLDFYNGEALAAKGDVIVITTNYRLGAFGFFYTGTDDAPGNVGMFDLVEALSWVHKNIEHFGGDKDSVTLFGQSAGGIAIGMFCVSPLTRGLFKRAIMQSGSPTNTDGDDNNKTFEISQKLAEFIGCSNDSRKLEDYPGDVVACMKEMDADNLSKGLAEVTKGSSRSYYPRHGDEFLPSNPRQAIADGNFTAVDVLIGNNNGDGSTLLTKSMKSVFGFFGDKDSKVNFTFGESIIKENFKDYPDPESVVSLYLGDVDEEDYNEIRHQVFTSLGDFSRICPAVYFAESFAKESVNVYFYYFRHHSSNTPWAPWMLAVHFDETPYVFGYPLRYPRNYTEAEQILSNRMIQAWSSFAKTGVPTGGLWTTYSKENATYNILDIDVEGTGYGPQKKNCDFFRSFFGF